MEVVVEVSTMGIPIVEVAVKVVMEVSLYSNSGNELWMLAEVSQRRTSVTWWRCYAVCFDIEERADETAGITLSTSQQAEHQELPYHHREGVNVGDLATLSLQQIAWPWEGADKVVKVAGDATCNLLAVARPHLDTFTTTCRNFPSLGKSSSLPGDGGSESAS